MYIIIVLCMIDLFILLYYCIIEIILTSYMIKITLYPFHM